MVSRSLPDARSMRRRRAPLVALLVLVLLAGACSSGGAAADSAGDKLLGAVTVTPGPVSALTALVRIETSEPMDLSASVDGPGTTATTVVQTVEGGYEVEVVGLRASSGYTVGLRAERDGAVDTSEVSVTSGALPTDLPPIDVRTSLSTAEDGHLLLFNASRLGEVPDGVTPAYLVALDDDDQVVWYHPSPLGLGDADITDRHTVLYSIDGSGIREIDLLGRPLLALDTRNTADADPEGLTDPGGGLVHLIDADSAHHEVSELPDGHLLTITTAKLPLDDATSQALCQRTGVVLAQDLVLEVDRDGSIVHRWPMSDYFDPVERPGSDMCLDAIEITAPGSIYPDPVVDWTHTNAVVYDPDRNALIVSVRHLDAVIAIRYEADADGPAGELLWELGPHGTFDYTDGSTPAYHQHAPEVEDDGTLLLFDNGNTRPGGTDTDGTEPAYSRAVAYRLDTAAGTAEQVWEHRDTGDDGLPTWASFAGDADRQDDGNVLIDYAGLAFNGAYGSRLVEIAPSGDTVRDLYVGRSESWVTYRAEEGTLFSS